MELESDVQQSILNDDDRKIKRSLNGVWKSILTITSILMALFHLYTAAFGVMVTHVQSYTHLVFSFTILFILYKPHKDSSDKIKWYDLIFIIASIISFGYILFDLQIVLYRFPYVTALTWYQRIFAITSILLILEGTRRVIGIQLPILVTIFLAYVFVGKWMPGIFYHKGFTLDHLLDHLYLITEGIVSSPVIVSSTFLFLFVLFGSFLNESGVGNAFMELSKALAGQSTGGPAKVAVISSALIGMISGSAAANVVTTGSFTIPMMKKLGYKSEFAGAVEAAASTGGQIMPPVMGAGAFILAEFTGIPYSTVMLRALLPATLYFLCIFWVVHLRSIKENLLPLPKSEIPFVKEVIVKKGYLFSTIIVMTYMLARGYSPMFTGLVAIILCTILSWIKKDTRMGIKKIINAFEDGAKNMMTIITACASGGIIIGVVSLTGLGYRISSFIIESSFGFLPLALFMTMIAGLIFGMGLPTSAAYVVQAALLAPALVRMGVEPIAAHLFVFYFAIISTITPPVAISSYVAAGLAQSDPLKTGWTAVRLGIVAYIVPFLFVFNNQLLLIGEMWEILPAIITACIGTYALAASVEGFMKIKLYAWQRILLFIVAIMLIYPERISDIIGLICIVIIYVMQSRKLKRKNAYE